MFQFTGFAFMTYEFSHKYLLMISVSPKTCCFAPQAARPSHWRGVAVAPSVAYATPRQSHAVPLPGTSWKRPRAVQPRKRIFGITEIEGGFPHSEIRGSKVVRTSPRLIAAYHVLHRLSAPRHPPNTLKALDRSHYQHPPLGRGRIVETMRGCDRKTICFKHIRERRGQATLTNWQLVFSIQKGEPRRIDQRSDMLPLHDVRQQTRSPSSNREFSFIQGSHQAASSPSALGNQPSGGARRDRTDDLMLAKHALSQLSYGPDQRIRDATNMVGLGRLELPTSRLSSARSNQLSYKPKTLPMPSTRERFP